MKNRFEIGEAFDTTVVAVTDTTVFVDLSAKSEGLVDAAEFTDENGNVNVKEGDKITVFFAGETHDEMHFTTKIAKTDANTGMRRGISGGMFIPIKSPVTRAEKSRRVFSLLIFPKSHSVKREEAIETKRTKTALKPNITHPHIAEGRRAMTTNSIALSVEIES